MPKCFTEETREILGQCIRDRVGFRKYQMGKMAISSTNSGGVGMPVIDLKNSSSYSYRFDKTKPSIDHYLYSALEGLCYACGLFKWTDIGMLVMQYHYSYKLITLYNFQQKSSSLSNW
jgi:hypothetical protein